MTCNLERHLQPPDNGPARCIGCGDAETYDVEFCRSDRCPQCCEATECHVICKGCSKRLAPLELCEHAICVDCGECGHGEHGGCEDCGCPYCDEERAIDRDVARIEARRAQEGRRAMALEDKGREMRDRDLIAACRDWRLEREGRV